MMEGGLLKWFVSHVEELGLSLAFAFGGAGMVLFLGDGDRKKAGAVIFAALLVDAAATSITQGVLGWPMWAAIPVGLVCGLVGLPILRTVIKGGTRVEDRADDIADKGISLLPGQKGGDK